jgi:putative heme-binding domain-containing protein
MSLFGMLLCLGSVAAAQEGVDPEYLIPKKNPHNTPADVQIGARLFLAQCAGCHGPKGEGGRGAVLATSKLRHALDDESLFRVIRDGIKGTEMPAGYAVTTRETWQLAAYVRSLSRVPVEVVPGDPKRGEDIYHRKGNCAHCHVVSGQGGVLGPELTEIGARRSAAHLRAAVLDPEKALPERFLQVRVVTADGQRLGGLRLNEDIFTIQIRDLNGDLHSFLKAELTELQKEPGRTPMPSFRGALSAVETDDLIAYLVSLRGNQ